MAITNKLPTMEEWKASLIRLALDQADGNAVAAAKLIKVSHKTVYRWKERSCNNVLDRQ